MIESQFYITNEITNYLDNQLANYLDVERFAVPALKEVNKKGQRKAKTFNSFEQ